jgi:hypothetical protein
VVEDDDRDSNVKLLEVPFHGQAQVGLSLQEQLGHQVATPLDQVKHAVAPAIGAS